MKLKSFGCSFVYGNELSDCHGQPSQLTWPGIIAKHLKLSYECYARPGSGNLQILNQILREAPNGPALFIINWTWIDRFDYLDSYNDSWQTLLPNEESGNARYYFKNIHSQYRDKLTSLLHINTAIQTLKQYNQKFIMTAMDELLFEDVWHCDAAMELLQDSIFPYIQNFNGYSFLEWSRINGYPESDLWHPLEAAHQAAAEYVLKNFIPALSK
jgi:hypothetical protein